MSSYFKNVYSEIRYPKSSKESRGLRNAQIGAIHAISSFFTLKKEKTAIVVMPTGSGKTAVLMMTPYILCAEKVLVVTPSVMVRGQIVEDFMQLITLKKANVFNEEIQNPAIFELKNKYEENTRKQIDQAEVVVATPICALSLAENDEISKVFDLVLIDEAHHTPAKTWEKILINTKQAQQILLTATPFRLDNKEIKGNLVYNYPLSLAYKDGIFGEIQYISIENTEFQMKDKLIAEKAESIFLADREKGFEHFLMVRVDTKPKAKEIEELYSEVTDLRLRRIDSSMSNLTIKKYLKELKQKMLDGIICVDMLGEGFDFPNLKIAAIHNPHKSLANTLQFIGRFARTNADNIGSAKFIAMNDNELLIENTALYTKDAIWQDMIIDMSENKIYHEETTKEYIQEYQCTENENIAQRDELSLYSIRPNYHAKVYKASGFNIMNQFPDICQIEWGPYINENDNTVVAVGKQLCKPKWSSSDQILDSKNILYLVHYQQETGLLFIYSQVKSEINYEIIADSFCESIEKISKTQMHRVLAKLEGFEIFNSGLLNRYNESGESYRISAGADVSQNIDPSTGKVYSAGHVFCRAVNEEDTITIGYSSGSKMWSSKYDILGNYVKWCDDNGIKIMNNELTVKTNTNFDYLPIPERLKSYPNNIFMCDFSARTYSEVPPIYIDNSKNMVGVILDISIKIKSINSNEIELLLYLDQIEETIFCDIDGRYTSKNDKLFVFKGRKNVAISEYLNEYPLIYRTTDDVMIQGIDYSKGNPEAIVFDKENIIQIEWVDKYGTDIHVEINEDDNPFEGNSIQATLKTMLCDNTEYKYVIYDHTTGEIADFITVLENENTYEITFYHVKKMTAKNYNSRMEDVYEVAGQAVKSIIWLKTNSTLLRKVAERRKSNHCEFLFGEYEDFIIDIRSADKQIKGTIVIVQPSISKETEMPDKIQEVLAAANYYIQNSGRVKSLEIWGSK